MLRVTIAIAGELRVAMDSNVVGRMGGFESGAEDRRLSIRLGQIAGFLVKRGIG